MTCKDCIHYEACSGFIPTDLDQDVFDYCQKGIADEIPDIEERCSCFTDKADVVEVVRCKDCKYFTIDEGDSLGYCTCQKIPMNFVGELYPTEDFYCAYGERSKNED
jgi:hypothetical protein